MPGPNSQRKEIPFNGKLLTSDPAVIGTNFRTLKNMRYTDSHVRMVQGMAKINTTALTTYLKTRSAYHFQKTQPAESHVLVQAYNTGLTASQILENKTAIPTAGDFSATALFSDSSGAGRGYFCDAPDGKVVYANGVDTCIWGGDENDIGAFIVSSAAITDSGGATNPRDYSDIINNTKSDSENSVRIGGGIDASTVLLLHCDVADGSNTFIDSSGTGKTVTAGGDAQIDTAQAQFGTASGLFDGNGEYLSVPDSADWYMASSEFAIDFWVRFSTYGAAIYGLFNQQSDAGNSVRLYQDGTANTLNFVVRVAGSDTVTVSGAWTPVVDTWYHVAVIRGWGGNVNTVAIVVNGTQLATVNDGDPWPDIGAAFEVGRAWDVSGAAWSYLAGHVDEFRVSKGVARWTASYSVPASAYTAASRTWLIGTTLPISSVKYYISTGNTVASTMTMKEWNGRSWQSLAITDNTDTGASLAATGTVTFTSTVESAKPKYLEGHFFYWYQCSIDDGESVIYRVTVTAPFQNIVDMWDGVLRDVLRFYKKTASYLDNTTNILKDDYYSTGATTYSDISSLPAYSAGDNCLEIGFSEKITAIELRVAPEYTNSTAATVASVDYWDGTDYVTVGTLTDGTSESSISLAKSGVISWNNISLSDELKKVVSNSPPLYFYRLRFSQAIDASCRINYVGGVTAPKEIRYYKFPVFAQGRVLLCGDMAGKKNKAVCSGKYTPQVYNGSDSVEIYFGESGELTCGTELFSQFGSSLYSLVMMFKDYETWVVAGSEIENWANNTFLLSSSIGCPAPHTLKAINLAAEPGAGINRALAIWMGASGVYMSDGRAPIPIHGDIKEYFDKTDSRCVKASMIGDAVGWVDTVNQEYHLLIASGSSATTLNTELIYDIKRNKWFEIDRTAGLQHGIIVHDTDGNAYNYGFLDTGYIERLEYGNTFDGTAITGTTHFGDIALEGLANETQIDRVKLICTAKTTTTNTVTFSHLRDGSAGTATTHAMSPARSGYRLAMPFFTERLIGDPFHGLKFEMTTTNEAIGFEPLAAVISYHATEAE